MICFDMKGLTNKFFSLMKRRFMREFCSPRNKIQYEKSQPFEIVGEKMMDGTIPLV